METIQPTFWLDSNYAVNIPKPFDARTVLYDYDDLFKEETWISPEGNFFAYNGLTVSVVDNSNPSMSGIYMLFDTKCSSSLDTPSVSTNSWKRITDSDNISYVTPEMFGFKPWYSDATEYIQAAIDTKKPCYLYGHYTIKDTINMVGDKLKLYIEGTLDVQGSCGIRITGKRNIVGGSGEIYVSSNTHGVENGSAIKLVLSESCTENDITVKRITQDPTINSNVGIEVTGAETYGNGYFNRITSAIHFFNKGVWVHETEGQNRETWNTTMFIDAVFNGCAQAVVIDWGDSGGSFLRGSIQPCGNGHSILPEDFDVNLPVIKISRHWFVDTFIWDMGKEGKPSQSVNLYAIEVTGPYNTIFSNLTRDYFIITPELESTTRINGKLFEKRFGFLTATETEETDVDLYDNTNDVILNCLYNPNIVVKQAFMGKEENPLVDDFHVVKDGGYNYLFDGSNTMGRVVLTSPQDRWNWLFELDSPRSIRCVAVWGNRLPRSLTIEMSTTDDPSTFIEVGTLHEGIDYKDGPHNGRYNVAALVLDYNMISSLNGSSTGRKVVAVKLKFDVREEMYINRISIFDVAPNIISNTGGHFTGDVSFASGKGTILESPNGSKYKLLVDDTGNLTTIKL